MSRSLIFSVLLFASVSAPARAADPAYLQQLVTAAHRDRSASASAVQVRRALSLAERRSAFRFGAPAAAAVCALSRLARRSQRRRADFGVSVGLHQQSVVDVRSYLAARRCSRSG